MTSISAVERPGETPVLATEVHGVRKDGVAGEFTEQVHFT